MDYNLPVTGSGPTRAVSVAEHEAAVDEAIGRGVGVAVARANHTGTQPISTVAGLQAALDAKPSLDEVSAAVAGGRPGQQMRAFVSAAAGAPASLTPIADLAGVTSATLAGLGQVARVDSTPAIIATREAQAVQRGRVYRVHAYVRRLADGTDPAGNTVALQLARLDAAYAQLGVITVDSRILRVTDGLWHLTATVALDPGAVAGVDWTLAEGTVYVRPYVQVFTSDHQTAVAQIDVVDITEAASIEGGLDVVALAGAVEVAQGEAAAAAEDRALTALDRAAAELYAPAYYTSPEAFLESPTEWPPSTRINARTGAVWDVVATGEDFAHPVSEIGLRVVGEVAPISAFGFRGVGTVQDTFRAQVALDWLGRSPRRTLRWDRPVSAINGSLIAPDASNWFVQLPTGVLFEQVQDNMPTFIMRPTASRTRFGFYGEMATFAWSLDQEATDTEAIGFAFDPQNDIPDGLHFFSFGGIWNENGYSLLVRHPDATDITCPYWGWRIGEAHHQTRARGRLLDINSVPAAGAPAGIIDRAYVKPVNAVGDVLRFSAATCVEINSLEVNDAVRRAVYIESSAGVSIKTARFEKCNLPAGQSLMDVAGGSSIVTIGTLDLQAVNTAAASDCYGVVAYGGGTVHVTGAVIVRDCVASGAGRLRIFRATDDVPKGLPFGKFVLPPVVKMQTTSNNVTLYAKEQGAHMNFSAAVPIGPFVLAAVAGVAGGTNMIAAHDGTNAYFDIISPVDGFLVGVHIRLSAAITAGELAFRPYINGAEIPPSGPNKGAFKATITTGQDAVYYGIHKFEPSVVNQLHRVRRGDRLRVQVTPTSVTGGGNATVQLLIAQDAAG